MIDSDYSEPTHAAYADESQHNTGRYRSIALVSLPIQYQCGVTTDLRVFLTGCGILEVKWSALSDRRQMDAAQRMLGGLIERAVLGIVRADILLWDTYDCRHSIAGRDDIENFHRMFHHLALHVLQRRWPPGSIWIIYPGENDIVRWNQVQHFLNDTAENHGDYDPETRIARFDHVDTYAVQQIVSSRSIEQPLIMLADLLNASTLISLR